MISNMWLVMLVLTLGVLLRPSPCSALDAFAFELFLVEEAAFDVLETYPARGTPIVLVKLFLLPQVTSRMRDFYTIIGVTISIFQVRCHTGAIQGSSQSRHCKQGKNKSLECMKPKNTTSEND